MEALLEHVIAQQPGCAPAELCGVVVGLGRMAEAAAVTGGAWRPRAAVLGPLMGRVVEVRGEGGRAAHCQ